MNIPAGVDRQVTIAQFFGVAMTIGFCSVHGDFFTGMDHLFNGYHVGITDQKPGATRFKFILAGVCQTLVGAIMISDLFILLMQSTSVISMCLNFAGKVQYLLFLCMFVLEGIFFVARTTFGTSSLNHCLPPHELSSPSTCCPSFL